MLPRASKARGDASRICAEDMHKNMYDVVSGSFEWNEQKNRLNEEKHGVSFEEAKYAFFDSRCVIAVDQAHSTPNEIRHYCIASIERGVITVRFTYRNGKIRILGAGFWRKGRRTYEKREG